MKAWLGDLVLNAAVARELMKKRSERQSVVTNHNVCVSNEFLYNRANSILNLPKHITDDEKYRKLSEHQIGTSELSQIYLFDDKCTHVYYLLFTTYIAYLIICFNHSFYKSCGSSGSRS